MSLMRADQTKADIERPRRCAAGRWAEEYLSSAAHALDRSRRSRSLLAFSARHTFGMSLSDIARPLGASPSRISRDLDRAREGLRAAALKSGQCSESYFLRTMAYESGAGI